MNSEGEDKVGGESGKEHDKQGTKIGKAWIVGHVKGIGRSWRVRVHMLFPKTSYVSK